MSVELLLVKCQLVNLVVRNTTPLDWWRNRVSIILEKLYSNIKVTNLRAILLLETDFNALNKIIFNNRVIPVIEASNSIPEEIIRDRRGQSFIHMALNKKLVCDIGNQLKKPMVVVSTDATNCYDRIIHLVSSLSY